MRIKTNALDILDSLPDELLVQLTNEVQYFDLKTNKKTKSIYSPICKDNLLFFKNFIKKKLKMFFNCIVILKWNFQYPLSTPKPK
jgi:hypothetical protein